MRRLGQGLCLVILAVLLAGAAPSGPIDKVKALHEARIAKLRAALVGGSPKPKAPAATIQSAIPLAMQAPKAIADLGQCRTGCAHIYYFCLAGQDAPSCPASWMQCLSDCDRATPPL